MKSLFFATFILISISGCAGKSIYFRSADPRFTIGKKSVSAKIVIPDKAPESSLIISCLGVKQLKDSKQKILYFRVFIDNKGKQPWNLDLKDQNLFLSSDLASTRGTFVTIPADEKATLRKIYHPGPTQFLELTFPLPDPIQSADQISSFVLNGKLSVAELPVEYRLPFARDEVSPDEITGNAGFWRDYHEKQLNSLPSNQPGNGFAPYQRVP